MQPNRRRRPHRLNIQKDRVRQLGRDKLGLRSDRAIAARLDMDPADLSHLLAGHRQPSPQIIAALLDMFGEPFDALFEVSKAA